MFAPDIFSEAYPSWYPISEKDKNKLLPLLKIIYGDLGSSDINIECSGALGINSSNFKVNFSGKSYLIKKWNSEISASKINKQADILLFLDQKNIPIAKPIMLSKEEYFYCFKGKFYTVNEFLNGDYFSGTKTQLKNAAISIAKFSNALNQLPSNQFPEEFKVYDLRKLGDTLKKFNVKRNNWQLMLGESYSNILKENWGKIKIALDDLKTTDFCEGGEQPIHFDLHPHNILFSGDSLVGFLDYDAIKVMPKGFALSFASLKLCRQALVNNKNTCPKAIAHIFKSHLKNNLDCDLDWSKYIYELATFEVLRRICVILNLNLEKNTDWNRVLPIQIEHLKEARILFK